MSLTKCHSAVSFVAIEPQPKFAAVLTNLSQVCPSFALVSAAAWKSNGTLDMDTPKDSRAAAIRFDAKANSSKSVLSVPTMDFSEVLLNSEWSRQARPMRPEGLNFLKLDIESAEYALLPHLLRGGALCS